MIPLLVPDVQAAFSREGTAFLQLGYGHAWTFKQVYDLDPHSFVTIETDFYLDGEKSQLLLGLSANAKPWQSGEADALSFLISAELQGLRTGMYKTWIESSTKPRLLLQTWHHLELQISRQQIAARVDGELMFEHPAGSLAFPRSGRFGVLGYPSSVTRLRELRLRLE